MKEIYHFFSLILSFSCVSCKLYEIAQGHNVISVKNFVFWPNATVPFYINPEHFDHEQSLAILTTLSMFAFKTCVKFAPVMALPNSDEHVLAFVNPTGIKRCVFDSNGHSALGPHLLTLGYDCLKAPNLEMVIMRSLGFPFEHNRSIRDDHIIIMMENVEPGAVEFFTKDINEPYELRYLPYDINSVMHYGNRQFSKNGHKTIIFKDISSQQNRIGLTTNDIRKFEIIYGPECLKRDRQERIDICQSYPNVARRKRDTSNVNDVTSDKKDQNSVNNTQINNKSDQNSDKNVYNGNKTNENQDKKDEVNFRSEKTTDTQNKNSDLNNNTGIRNTVDNRPATVSLDIEKIATKSLRVNPNITPPSKLEIPDNLHELGIEEQVQTIVENIYKVSAAALQNTRQKYCKTTEKTNLRTEKANDILGIINLVSDYAQGIVDDATANLTKFCDDSSSMTNYERVRCNSNVGADPRCPTSYRSTKHGFLAYSTQHRPIVPQSTKHWNSLKNDKYHNRRRSNVTAGKEKVKRRHARKSTTDANVRAKREIFALDESVRVKREISTPNGNDDTTITTENTSTVTTATGKQEIVTEKHNFTANINTVEDTEITTGKTMDTTESSHDLEVKKLDKSDLRMATGFPSKFRGARRVDYRSFMKSRPKDHPDSDVSNEKKTKTLSDIDDSMKDTSLETEKYMPNKKRESQIDIFDKIPRRHFVSNNKHETEIPPEYHEITFEKEIKDTLNRKLHKISLDKHTKKVPNRMYDIPLKNLHDHKISKRNHKTKDTDISIGKHEFSIYNTAKTLLDKGSEIQNRNDESSREEEMKTHYRKVKNMRAKDDNKPFRPSPIIHPKRKHSHGAESSQKMSQDYEEVIQKAKILSSKSKMYNIRDNTSRSSPGPSRFRVVRPESDDSETNPKEDMKIKSPHKIYSYKKSVVESWKNKKENKNIYEESSEGDGNENRKLERDRELERERNKRDRELEQGRKRDSEKKRELERNRNKERNRDRESERIRNRDRESEPDRNKNKEPSQDRNRDGETERDTSKERDHDKNKESSQGRNRDRETERDTSKERDHDKNKESSQGRNRDRETERDTSKERDHDKNKESSQDRNRDRETERDTSKEPDHDVPDHDGGSEQYKEEQDREQRDRITRDRKRDKGRESKRDRELNRDRELDRERELNRDSERDSKMPQKYKQKQEEPRINKNKRQKNEDSESDSKKDEDVENEKGSEPQMVQLSKMNKEFYRERRWPGGIVRYMIKPGLKYDYDDVHRRLEEVNVILKKRTCVRLEKITEAQTGQFEDYLYIDESPDYVTGRVGGKQNFGAIELLEGGQHRQHTAMMVMAMLGFYFEVSRHDRDSYIRVHLRHVRPDKLHHFEKIREDATLPVPYDYASATHPAWQFWRQFGVSGISSVATFKESDPDGTLMKSLGQNRKLLSDTDILKINSVYGVRCFLRKSKNKQDSSNNDAPKKRSRLRRYL